MNHFFYPVSSSLIHILIIFLESFSILFLQILLLKSQLTQPLSGNSPTADNVTSGKNNVKKLDNQDGQVRIGKVLDIVFLLRLLLLR